MTKQNQGSMRNTALKRREGNAARLEDNNSRMDTKTFSSKFTCLSSESSRVRQIAGKYEQKDTQSNWTQNYKH